jgi:ABC-type sugar transport system permease subunit
MNDANRALRAVFLIAPSAFMASALLIPALGGLALSFDYHGPSLRNYGALIGDPMFWRALSNNLLVPAGSVMLELAIGLALALVMTARQKPSALFEIAAILPFAIPEIVLLSVARYLFMPRGYLNAALAIAGASAMPWIQPNHPLALATVMMVDAWHVTPVVMLILVAGLQTIPAELYEAAQIDGAGTWATFRWVTLPMLRPAIAGAVVLRGVDALRIFSTTLVLTGAEGVPVLSTYAYQQWTDAQAPGPAMAASMVLALVMTAIGAAGAAAVKRFSSGQTAAP